MKNWLQIIRYKNLIIITLTMFSVFFFYAYFSNNIAFSGKDYIHFTLLVSITVLIAGAGNIINDIFDVEADKINKPDKVFIGKAISKEDAQIVYWTLNSITLLLSFYLSYVLGSFWFVVIPAISFFGLWIYSKSLKKISFFGNLIVAVLTGIVPLFVGVFIHETLVLSGNVLNLDEIDLSISKTVHETILADGTNGLVFFFVLFAFLLNFAREWIKDIEDIAGDKLIRSQSLAIQLGEKKMKMYTSFFLMMTIGFLVLILANATDYTQLITIQFPLFIVIIFLLLSLYFLFHKKRISIKKADLYLKMSFLFGLILPFWWVFFL